MFRLSSAIFLVALSALLEILVLGSVVLAQRPVSITVDKVADLDGDAQLNGHLPPYFQQMGQYSPRFRVASSFHPDIGVPPGCSVVQVNSLERHGARHFTAGARKTAAATLASFQKALTSANVTLPARYAFLPNATIQAEVASLVPYGALQAYLSGKSTAEVYRSLLGKNPLPPFVRTSGTLDSDRVILTAKYWKLGLSGRPFPSGSLATSDDVRKAPNLPEPDVIISEAAGQNNTLDVSTCDASEAQDPDPEDAAWARYGPSTLEPIVGGRLSADLAKLGVSFQPTYTDLINLFNLCSFETLGRAIVTDGSLPRRFGSRSSDTLSPFCGLWEAGEFEYYQYILDVGKYNGAGYGNAYYKARAQGYLRELLARLTGQAPPLSSPTSLNSTLDGSANTFPLDRPVYFDGSHDNNIGPIAAAFGLFDGSALGTDSHAERAPHNWRFSTIAPLGGKIVFEKLTCGVGRVRSRDYIRVRANGAVISPRRAKWCPTTKTTNLQALADNVLESLGLCPLDSIAAFLAWVNDAVEWDKCYQSS